MKSSALSWEGGALSAGVGSAPSSVGRSSRLSGAIVIGKVGLAPPLRNWPEQQYTKVMGVGGVGPVTENEGHIVVREF